MPLPISGAVALHSWHFCIRPQIRIVKKTLEWDQVARILTNRLGIAGTVRVPGRNVGQERPIPQGQKQNLPDINVSWMRFERRTMRRTNFGCPSIGRALLTLNVVLLS